MLAAVDDQVRLVVTGLEGGAENTGVGVVLGAVLHVLESPGSPDPLTGNPPDASCGRCA